MTDSDTESFHSAIDSLSDQEDDVNISNTSVNNDESDEGRKINNKYEFNGYNEMENKYSDNEISEVLSVKEMVQNLSSFSESSKCQKVIPGKQNYHCLSMNEANSDSAIRETLPVQELKTNNAISGQMLDSQIEWPNSQCNNIEIEKISRLENNDKSDKIFGNDNKLFDINKFRGEKLQNYEGNNDKISGIGNKDSEHELISEIMDNANNDNMTGEVKRFEENVNIDHDGWDDWELQYPEKDKSGTEILDKELPQMLASDEKEQVIVNSESEREFKTKEEVNSNKSFWDWTEFSDVVAAVGKGLTSISSTVESSLGLPTPEELVRSQCVENSANTSVEVTKESEEVTNSSIKSYSKLFAGFGANVVTGSLDVLEALGKKTFEKLTVPEQGSEKRRFIFEPERGQNLSEVLRELRENRAEEVALETNCISKREVTFIDFFEKFGGMLHLEGLEMLSKNYLRKIPPQRRSNVNEIFAENLANTLEDYQENQQKSFLQDYKEILLAIALPYNSSGLIDSYTRCQEHLERLSDSSDQIFELFLECLADFTAQSVQSIHKFGQLLLITETEVKQEPFSELHNLIGRQISLFSNQFAQHISAVDAPSEEIDELITAVFLAAGDSFSYIQQSFRLLRPLLIL